MYSNHLNVGHCLLSLSYVIFIFHSAQFSYLEPIALVFFFSVMKGVALLWKHMTQNVNVVK